MSEQETLAAEWLRTNAMRADDDMRDTYANQYMLTAEAQGTEPDWDVFAGLWAARNDSDEEMASLLAEVMGVDYEEALAWVTRY